MSEEALRKFIDKINKDTAFRQRLTNDVAAGLAEFELSPAEQVALATNDEDALRRLAGGHVVVSVTRDRAAGPLAPSHTLFQPWARNSTLSAA